MNCISLVVLLQTDGELRLLTELWVVSNHLQDNHCLLISPYESPLGSRLFLPYIFQLLRTCNVKRD